jgi:hypothetical protein
MQIGTYVDGRPFEFDETTCTMRIGTSTITIAQLLGWDQAGQVTWASPETRAWAVAQVQAPGKTPTSQMLTRYSDAYIVARTTTAVGKTVKVLSIILGVLLTFAGWSLASRLGAAASAVTGGATGSVNIGSMFMNLLAGPLLGFTVALPIFLLGVLVSAQGQVLKASLDSAVNSSPFLSREDVIKVMSLD